MSVYFMLALLPLLLFFGLLIDVMRWRAAEQETEQAVKAGVRSVMSAFSKDLHAYGLFALDPATAKSSEVFVKTVEGSLSSAAGASRFAWISPTLDKSSAKVTPMFPLSNHDILKQQILEEMKVRAPLNFTLELTDKWKKNGVAAGVGQAAQFGQSAQKIEKLIEERDKQLGDAWDAFIRIRTHAGDVTPFYQTQLRDLNELSALIGVHTLEDTQRALQQAKQSVTSIQEQLRAIDGSIASLARAGAGAAMAIQQLAMAKQQLIVQYNEATQRVTQYEQLMNHFIKYGELLLVIQRKSSVDLSDVQPKLKTFQTAFKEALKANDTLNEELQKVNAASGGTPAGTGTGTAQAQQSFASVKVFDREELQRWEAEVGGAVAQFAGFHAQMNDGIWFTQQKYATTLASVEGYRSKLNTAHSRMAPHIDTHQQSVRQVQAAKREQRTKAMAVLDQVRRGLGTCSLISDVDPYEPLYHELQGNPNTPGVVGFYQVYMSMNAQQDPLTAPPAVPMDNVDEAGLGALKLLSGLESLLTDVRDEFYIDEYAISKFSYRTLGLEKDAFGRPRTSKELSAPEQHPLTNQEVEYLIYGGGSCASNYSLAYAEMFAFRFAVGITEALMRPETKALAAGSPWLVVLTAIAEGAWKAQQDMTELVQGDAVPVSSKLSPLITMTYKDYLRLFLLLHSREQVLLSRIQALVQLNTNIDLAATSTYVSGNASTAHRHWFMGGIMRALGESSFGGCSKDSAHCLLTRTADYRY